MSSLIGTNVAIFGGASGIGLCVAKQLVQMKVSRLIIIGTTQSKLDAACVQLEKLKFDDATGADAEKNANESTNVQSAIVDMTDEEAMQQFYATYPDCFFNHVIITAGRSAFLGNVIENKRNVNDLKRQMDYKFFNQMSAVLNGHPKVVDGGSFVLPGHGNTSLSVANAAVEASVKGLANDLGFARKIRINCVSPGMTDTDAYDKMGEEKKASYQKSCREKSPLYRIATPNDVADSVMYLISNPNVTGQVVVNDAGLTNV
eukprot:Awhi_evm1s6907